MLAGNSYERLATETIFPISSVLFIFVFFLNIIVKVVLSGPMPYSSPFNNLLGSKTLSDR
jgi:hypothetical protein